MSATVIVDGTGDVRAAQVDGADGISSAERLSDMRFIAENFEQLAAASIEGRRRFGPGAVVVDTTTVQSHPNTGGAGNPVLFFPKDMLLDDDEALRLIGRSETEAGYLVLILLKEDNDGATKILNKYGMHWAQVRAAPVPPAFAGYGAMQSMQNMRQ